MPALVRSRDTHDRTPVRNPSLHAVRKGKLIALHIPGRCNCRGSPRRQARRVLTRGVEAGDVGRHACGAIPLAAGARTLVLVVLRLARGSTIGKRHALRGGARIVTDALAHVFENGAVGGGDALAGGGAGFRDNGVVWVVGEGDGFGGGLGIGWGWRCAFV